MAGSGLWSKIRPKRSRMLLQITLLLVFVVIASGLTTFFIFSGSMDDLIDESKNNVLELQGENSSSVTDSFVEMMLPQIRAFIADMDLEAIIAAYQQEEITPIQEYVNGIFEDLIDNGFQNLTLIMLVDMSGIMSADPQVIAASDTQLIYSWEIPDYILDAVDRRDNYLYLEDGVPELDISGEQLLVFNEVEDPATGLRGITLGVKPMVDEIVALDSFYASEKSSTTNLFILVILITLVVIIFIAFFILSVMIYRNITRPLDELSHVAGEVMDGNLDVDIPVRKGEEFEGLKLAFREMVESLRKIMDMSTGESGE